jgi:predicted XRE-type DNA-binding protein
MFSGMQVSSEAENLKVRADLMIELTQIIESRKATQAAAAALLGVTRPRVSDLMRGKIDRFSIDSLVEMLGRAGVRVSFAVKTRKPVGRRSPGGGRPLRAGERVRA